MFFRSLAKKCLFIYFLFLIFFPLHSFADTCLQGTLYAVYCCDGTSYCSQSNSAAECAYNGIAAVYNFSTGSFTGQGNECQPARRKWLCSNGLLCQGCNQGCELMCGGPVVETFSTSDPDILGAIAVEFGDGTTLTCSNANINQQTIAGNWLEINSSGHVHLVIPL